MIHGSRITTFCIAILLSLSLAAIAAELTVPNTFSNGEPADADQVNANFEAVKTAVDDNNQKIDDNNRKIDALSEPKTKSESVTYSAMGFSPGKAVVSIPPDYNFVTSFETMYEKNGVADGSLAVSGDESGVFYHCVTLRAGVEITRIRARVKGAVRISLRKQGDPQPVATMDATQRDIEDIQVDNINHTIEPFPVA